MWRTGKMKSMEQKLMKKVNQIDDISQLRDLENKKRELGDAEYNLVAFEEEIDRTKREMNIFEKIADVMLKNYGKLPDKVEHKWEATEEYWELMKGKQHIDNERTQAKFKNGIQTLKKQIGNTKDTIAGLKKSILLQEIELKEKSRGKSNG